MPLRVIGELLADDGADPERLRALLETEERVFELALADERERISEQEMAERFDTPPEVLRRLADLGVIGPEDGGYSPSDARIVEAIARFRAGGYDERIGFTVHDAARFLDPLEQLAVREVSLLTEKLVGRFEQDRAIELLEAGGEPLRALIAAMHTKLLAREIQRRRPGSDTDPPPPTGPAELD
jgi:DNA-binding transcriptional MerR regulator